MSNRLPLSAAVITLNEADNLPRCLESVRNLVSEIVVVDSGSTDATREIATKFGAVFEIHPWQGHVRQKNIALSKCTQPWVLCLDADEEVSPELTNSIRGIFANGGPGENGFVLNRFNFYLGRWIHHAWYPEWRLRLVRRQFALWGGLNPHDKLEVQGSTGRLSGHLFHYPFSSIQEHLESELRYAAISAESYAREGRSCHWYHAVFSPWLAFLKIIVLKWGWLDGWRGWVIAGARAMNTFAKYAAVLERKRSKQAPKT